MMLKSIEVSPASPAFRLILGLVLRKRLCNFCKASLAIVWIEIPRNRESGYDSTVTAGYRCTTCARVTKWNGELLDQVHGRRSV